MLAFHSRKRKCPQGSGSNGTVLLVNTIFHYDDNLNLDLERKKESYINFLKRLNSFEPSMRQEFLDYFPTARFRSLPLHPEHAAHQPLMDFYCERLEYILNFILMGDVKTKGQQSYKIDVLEGSQISKIDNVFWHKTANIDSNTANAENTCATLELKTPSIVQVLNEWKVCGKISSESDGFAGLHSILRQITIQSFTSKVSNPGLLDFLTYYPTVFDYHPISQSNPLNKVSLKVGQVPFYKYDNAYDENEEYKGNMFLAFYANVYSNCINVEPYPAARFDQWAKFLANNQRPPVHLDSGISSSSGSSRGVPSSSGSGAGAGSDQLSSSQTSGAIDYSMTYTNNNNNNNYYYYFCCSPLQESSVDHLNQVFSITVEGCSTYFGDFDHSGKLKDMESHKSVVVKCLDKSNWEDYAEKHTWEFGDTLEWEELVSCFNNEVGAYQRIGNYNKGLPIEQRIHVPEFLFFGETNRGNFRRIPFNENGIRLVFGPFMVLERLNENMRPPATSYELLKTEQEIHKLAQIGILHKDIRASNFLFDEENDAAYVLDFEYVKFAEDGQTFSSEVLRKEIRQAFSKLQKTIHQK
ncbi:unnamed protein product [Ambrosiozyma monospora]|uniref:Unnamed protein product n=1 Tax=Ambrosiozyma monospora TaxID=43982 RepID=A0ACB5T4A8_AMBMO|nr:unnamed protein product [Ambrosiozyma monospora]